MKFKILADEDVDYRIIKEMRRNNNFEVISVLEQYQGVSDKKILELAKRHNALLLTEDSDLEN